MSEWIPSRIDRRVRVFAWLSLISEITIVGTGGAVRLTGSGLGCPTWPACVAGSLVPSEEMGLHGVIEFANRLMTGVIGIIALVMVVLLLRLRKQRRDLFVPAVVLVVGVLAQAVIGGITVLTGLNPFIVGGHFVISLLMVAVAALLVHRVYAPVGKRMRVVPAWFAGVTHLMSAFVAITIIVGVLTTASGPHSGDEFAGRTGFDVELLSHLHAWPAYVMLALSLVLLGAALRNRMPLRLWLAALVGVQGVQIVVGIIQANNGLPAFLVGAHMVLACILTAVLVAVILRLKAVVQPLSQNPAETPVPASAQRATVTTGS
ncbi:MAG: COX15/CtaA family protein [Cryobacterium sp.]